MDEGTDYYREADLKRFTRIGVVALIVVALVGWFFYRRAQNEVSADNNEAFRRSASQPSGSRAPSDPDSLEARIRNWSQGQAARSSEPPPPR